MGGLYNMPEMQENVKKTGEKKVSPPLKYGSGGRYAVELEDELPPLANLKFVDEAGRLTDIKRVTEEEVSYFWRAHLKTISALIIFAGVGIIIIMLSASARYLDGLWLFLVGVFGFIVNFLLGLLPI